MATYARAAAAQLRALCEALGLGAHAGEAQALFARVSRGWAEHAIDRGPLWRSELTDDHTPYEFSISFRDDRPELRILVEAQTPAGSVLDQWRAGLALHAALTDELGLCRARFDAIHRALAPGRDSTAAFALWHAVVFDPGGRHLVKVYLNPRIDGAAGAARTVRAALAALGLDDAWREVARLAGADGEPCYLSLDLVDTGARVKVYVAHPGRTLAGYADQLAALSAEAAEDAAALIGPFAGPDARFAARPLLTCLGFRAGAAAPEVTIHFPVRCYVRSDQDSLDGIAACLGPRAAAQLAEAVRRFAGVAPSASRGRVSYVSRARTPAGVRHTVYVAPLCHTAT